MSQATETPVMGSEIATKARFDRIRYAQAWEDGDLLLAGLGECRGKRLLSIGAAGDNALAMLLLDPAEVIAVDLSQAQLACLHLRIAALRTLSHAEFLALAGARASDQRSALLDRALMECDANSAAFWQTQREAVLRFGFAGVGKFENYFRIFRKILVPWVHRQSTIDALFEPRTPKKRQSFLDQRFNNRRFRTLITLFFSRFVMARLGRDPAFFDHVSGSPAAHVRSRVEHATVLTDPSQNPYLHWIMYGHHGDALPITWRAEHYDTLRARADRLTLCHAAIEDLLTEDANFGGFNLSDIFEYMSEDGFAQLYEQLLDASSPGARLVYWNMMAPRRAPAAFVRRVNRLQSLEDDLKTQDKAFFYSDFVVEEVLG